MNEISNSRVSEDVRRAHSRAVNRRDNWRDKYNVLSRLIRSHKNTRSNMTFPREADMVLRGLQIQAVTMMELRHNIRQELRDTAYAYVDLED